MRIDSMLAERRPVFSFEFFPPRTPEGESSLFEAIGRLRSLEPSFVSVTYGANGSTRIRTVELVKRIRRELEIEPMAHLTCVGDTREALRSIVEDLAEAGLENVFALRGDAPNGDPAFTVVEGGFAHGNELVEMIHSDYDLCVGSACYPESHLESSDPLSDLAYTRLKVEAGASFLITQLFFDNRVYFDFVTRARAAGITVPIIPGIMPITRVDQITRFTQKIGASIPQPLREALDERADDPEATLELGVAWGTLQCAELLAAGAPGIHFCTLNRSPATRAILSALRASKPWERAGLHT